jgi:hypothetical protein
MLRGRGFIRLLSKRDARTLLDVYGEVGPARFRGHVIELKPMKADRKRPMLIRHIGNGQGKMFGYYPDDTYKAFEMVQEEGRKVLEAEAKASEKSYQDQEEKQKI